MAGLISGADYPPGRNNRVGACAGVGEFLYPQGGAGFVAGKILYDGCVWK